MAALRADGGASVVDLLLQLQADQLQVPVTRPTVLETTALGAAYLAGLAEGVWSDLGDVGRQWALDAEFTPRATATAADSRYAEWRRAGTRDADDRRQTSRFLRAAAGVSRHAAHRCRHKIALSILRPAIRPPCEEASRMARRIRTGQVLQAVVLLFMVFDGVIHLLKIAPVVAAGAGISLTGVPRTY